MIRLADDCRIKDVGYKRRDPDRVESHSLNVIEVID